MSMPRDNCPDLPALSNTEAKDLAGRFVTIEAEIYYFKDYDPDHPGQPPWRSGAEGKAYPLLNRNRGVAAWLKFFTHPTPKRLERTAWLIGQQMHTWLRALAAAPLLWTDSRLARQPADMPFDFAGYLARAVPGETWLELKTSIAEGSLEFPEDFRWRCVQDLIHALAVLEHAGIVHGDLSPNNIVIDLAAPADAPALYLIDFDAFVAPAAGPNGAVTVAEGGTYGTDGYCPPDLAAAVSEGDTRAAPYSDRYGRDMLLVELLLMDRGLSPDSPPTHWDRGQLERRYAACRARSRRRWLKVLSHIEPAAVFAWEEPERTASRDLAAILNLSLPQGPLQREVAQRCRSTPAILGDRLPSGNVSRFSRQSPGDRNRRPSYRRPVPELLQVVVRRGWRRAYAEPSLWSDLAPAVGCLAVLFSPALVAALILFVR